MSEQVEFGKVVGQPCPADGQPCPADGVGRECNPHSRPLPRPADGVGRGGRTGASPPQALWGRGWRGGCRPRPADGQPRPADGVGGGPRIAQVFENARRQGRAALVAYLTMGYPTLDAALELVPALVRGGADIIELGVPFSDPVADGPTIEAASHAALANGMTPDLCLEQAAALRSQGVDRPLILMGYYNPILAQGIERHAQRCQAAGIDGLIVPDLPPEEAQELRAACDQRGLALIYLAAPTTDSQRLQRLAQETRGFLYVVSRLGTTGAVGTGAMQADPTADDGLRAQLALAREGRAPVAVGFGVSRAEDARALARLADGVIVGSAIVRRAPDGPSAVEAFVRELGAAV